eukprot:COSAG05_NODE_147_length_16383_cov_266.102555_19_plen_120_part_00
MTDLNRSLLAAGGASGVSGSHGHETPEQRLRRLERVVALKHDGDAFFLEGKYAKALRIYYQAHGVVADEVVEYDHQRKELHLVRQLTYWMQKPPYPHACIASASTRTIYVFLCHAFVWQ